MIYIIGTRAPHRFFGNVSVESSIVKSEMKVPNRKIIVGNPGKIIKNVSDEMLNWKIEGTKLYQQLPKDCMSSLKECSPNRAKANYTNKKVNYRTWKKTKK